MKLAVCVPVHSMVDYGFAYDLAQLMAHTAATFAVRGGAIGLVFSEGTYIADNRERIAKGALDAGVTHILWIDADMRFPKDAFFRLLRHDEEMVGINYCTRGVPPVSVAIKATGMELEGTEPSRVVPAAGLEEVDALGLGLCLVRSSAFEKVERPWFNNRFAAEHNHWIGEDVDFCRRLREAGGRVMLDHDLSRECAHAGRFEYHVEHIGLLGKELENALQ